MVDAPLDVFAVMIGIAAFLIALKASNQSADLRRRLDALEAAAAAPTAPSLMPFEERTVAPSTRAAEPPPLPPEAELAPPLTTDQGEPPQAGATAGTAAPPPPPFPTRPPVAAPGLEE